MLGWAGCLLFTDPINKAPVVTIKPPTVVDRGVQAEFSVSVTDDRDNPATLQARWAEFETRDQGCTWITAATWVGLSSSTSSPRSNDAPYDFMTYSLNPVCVCALAVDHDGAAGFGCSLVGIVNPPPIAKIADASGASSGSFPLCSNVHLKTAWQPLDPSDQVEFKWAGTDPSGKNLQPIPCTNSAATSCGSDSTDCCFYAATPGNYAVTLEIDDTVVTSNGSKTSSTTTQSSPTTYVASVLKNTPACIERTDPDATNARRVLLSRSTDLGGSYQSRTFQVFSVADDCEPYPPLAGSGKASAQFYWYVYDTTQSNPNWVRQYNTSNSFTVSQSMFPSALPGDSIELRLEVRDSTSGPGESACSMAQDMCCASGTCTGAAGDCVRWTTWTVQFQP
jgi:hypothetical protein